MAHAEPSTPADPATPPEMSGDLEVEAAGPLLEKPQRGKAALGGLGDQVRVAALRNGMRPAELRSVLRSDRSAWLDGDGRLRYVDPPAGEMLPSAPLAAPIAPLADTFALHSNPGANLTIFLDFDGAEVTNSAWNIQDGVAPGFHQGWDPAGDGPGFNADERLMIQQVWAIVAEDYAPFEVDVTTEDPGDDRLTRTSSADSVYGTRVLVTDSNDPYAKICPDGCGGVAYVDVFDRVGTVHQPAWVFPQALGNDAKAVAEAASHEAGHNLGLSHDGTSTAGYYDGHGDWAPIMGVGYDSPISQWSRGSYPGATNAEDDLQVLTGYLGARQDEASDFVHMPSALLGGPALIGTPNDVDAYLLGSCAAGTTVSVAPVAFAPNLDIQATLHDSAGAARAVSDPASGRGDGITASGMAAQLTIPSDGTGWVVEVAGVGKGTWATQGYDDYGSLGSYTVDASACDGQLDDGVPAEPRVATPVAAERESLTLTWEAPDDEGSGPVTGYRVSRSGQAEVVTLPEDARSFTFTGLQAGTTYQLSVLAVNASGAGHAVTVSATTAAPLPSAPSAPRNLVGNYLHQGQKLQAFWTEPADSGTEPVTGYAIFLDGVDLGAVDATSRGVDITNPGGFAEGDYLVEIAAVNAVGMSPRAAVTVNVLHPQAPANDNIADAQVLVGASGNVQGDNSAATGEPTDPPIPSSFPGGGYSVWYSWTPEVDGQVTFSTSAEAAGRDTTIAAYTGTPGALSLVAGADDVVDAHGLISFPAVAGTRYLIAVDGFDFIDGSGPFTLSWSQDVPSDVVAPVVSEFNFSPKAVDVAGGEQQVTVSVRVVDESGVEPPTMVLRSDGTEQQLGFGVMSRVAGTVRDGVYERTVTVPTSAASGEWSVRLFPVSDVLGNEGGFVTHPSKLVVSRTPAVAVPDAPAKPEVSLDGRTATISWVAPAANGAAITGYTVTGSNGAGVKTVVGDVRSVEFPGLTRGTTYSFTVVATNAVGDSEASPASESVSVEATPPEAPVKPTVRLQGQSATVSWVAPAANGSPVTGYTVTGSNGAGVKTVAGDVTSVQFPGLTRGATYSFRVVASNAVGDSEVSPVSDAVQVAALAPAKPKKPSAKVRGKKVVITWVAPATNGAPITGYLIDLKKGKDRKAKAGARKLKVKKLKPGKHKIRVIALSAAGPSAASGWVTVKIKKKR